MSRKSPYRAFVGGWRRMMRDAAASGILAVWKRAAPRNRMREILTSGSVGGLVEQSLILPGRCCTVMVWYKQSCRRRFGTSQTDNRFPRNLGDPVASSAFSGRSHRVNNSRPRQCTRLPRSEHNECNRGIAKRRKRSAARWAAGSRSTFILPLKPGNWSRRTRWREGKTERGCLMLDPGPGNTSEASYLDPRITVTTQDSSPGLQLAARRIHHQRNRVR